MKSFYRWSISRQLTLVTILASALILLATSGAILLVTQAVIVAQVRDNSRHEAEAIAYQLDSYYSRMLQVPATVAAVDTTLIRQADHDKEISHVLTTVLLQTPGVLNQYVAYEKGVFTGRDYLLMAFTRDSSGEIVPQPANVPGAPGFDPNQPIYEYHEDPSWYRLALDAGRPVWGPPYLDAGGTNQVIVSAVSPIVDENGKQVGVAGNDVLLSYMSELVKDVRLGESGYAFVVSADGTMITFPQEGWVMEKSLADLTGKDGTPIQLTGADLHAAQDGLVDGIDPLTGRAAWLAYIPIQSTGWGLVGVLPQAKPWLK